VAGPEALNRHFPGGSHQHPSRIDGIEHSRGVEMFGERQLDEDAVDRGVSIQLGNSLQQLLFRDGFRQVQQGTGEPRFVAGAVPCCGCKPGWQGYVPRE
jgi:hypothetical protein